jgi:hypothetical protein
MSAAESPGECRAKRNPAVLITLAGLTDGDSIGLLVRLYHKLITHRQTMLVGVLFYPIGREIIDLIGRSRVSIKAQV